MRRPPPASRARHLTPNPTFCPLGITHATRAMNAMATCAPGAAARYLIGQGWPTAAGAFPASTLGINVLGCALIGVLMVLSTGVRSRQRLIRPFLGTGVLGGFTTFSTYTVDIQRLVVGGHVNIALFYLALTPIGALLAVWVSATATRRLVNWRIP